MPFTVTTWNVENFSSGSQNYETKRDHLAAVLQRLSPDVAAVQEVLDDEAALELAAALGYRAIVAGGDQRGNRVAFLTRRPIIGSPEQITSWRPPHVQAFDFDADGNVELVSALPRPPLRITVAHGGTKVDLINVHLKSKLLTYPGGQFSTQDEELRAQVAYFALQRRAAEVTTIRCHVSDLLAGGRNVIVLGTMNDGPEAATTTLLCGPLGSQSRWPEAAIAQNDQSQRSNGGDAQRLFNVTRLVPAAARWSRRYQGGLELLDQILASEGLVPRVGGLRRIPAVSILNDTAPNIGDYPRNQELEPDHAAVTAKFQM